MSDLVNTKINKVLLSKKIDKLSSLFTSEQTQKQIKSSNKKILTKNFKTSLTNKIKNTNNLEKHVVKYCLKDINQDIDNLQDIFISTIKHIQILFDFDLGLDIDLFIQHPVDPDHVDPDHVDPDHVDPDHVDPDPVDPTEPQLKVSQNNETDDANLNEFTGPIGKIGPKGVSGKNGRLISTIDKNVINKLQYIDNILDKIIEKIKYSVDNNET